MHEVAITGYGIVSAIGTNVPEFTRRMFAGDSGLTAIRGSLVAESFPVPVAAPIQKADLMQPSVLSNLDPDLTPDCWRFAGSATEEALQFLPKDVPFDAIVYGTMEGFPFGVIQESFRGFSPESFNWHVWRPETSLELMRRMVEERGHGRVHDRDLFAMTNTCVSGNQALGMAFHRIRSGQWKRALVGAVYAYCNSSELMNFWTLGALATGDGPPAQASRPFSKDRSGCVIGEGAATLVLEARETAVARGATVLGGISGYASTTDAYRITDGRADGKGAAKAMENAIKDAGVNTDQIDAISAHGTSTVQNDRLETKAIKSIFGVGAYQVPVVSLKSQIGHPSFAGGALEAVASALMLSEQKLAPTINYTESDPECDLDYVPNRSRPAELLRVMSNSFGFGGQNACLVMEHQVVQGRDAR